MKWTLLTWPDGLRGRGIGTGAYSPSVVGAPHLEYVGSLSSADSELADIARLLGVSRQRGHQLTGMSGFPKPRVIAGRRMWKRTRIEAWADQHWWGTLPWRVRH